MACILSCVTRTMPDVCEAELEVNIRVREVCDFILFGRILDCDTGVPLVGAIVKAFRCIGDQEVPIGHTFSGCNGEYLLNIPFDLAGQKVIIKASCASTTPPVPCECDPDCSCP